MTTNRRRLTILGLLFAGLTSLAGCESGGHFTLLGYTTQPTFDTSIKTVYVPIPRNVTYRRELEFTLQKAVIRELNNSPYRVTSDRARADTELDMKIVTWRKSVININQLGETREAELAFNVEVIWRDLRPGCGGDILSNPKRFDPTVLPLPGEAPEKTPTAIPLMVSPTATYVPELGGSNTSAEFQAAAKAARQIVNMMEIWPTEANPR
jgi:hypothetical protein